MFDRFADEAKDAMNRARRHAQRLDHEYLGTEHMLLGLIGESNDATVVLQDLGIDLDAIRDEVSRRVPAGPSAAGQRALPFTSGARRALELSMEEAQRLSSRTLGTEHLLRGLLREGEGVAARVLTALGLRMEALDATMGASSSSRRVRVFLDRSHAQSLLGFLVRTKRTASAEEQDVLSKLAEQLERALADPDGMR